MVAIVAPGNRRKHPVDKTKKPITYRRLRGITFTTSAATAGSGASGAEGRRPNRDEVSEDSGWVEAAREGKAVKKGAVVMERKRPSRRNPKVHLVYRSLGGGSVVSAALLKHGRV
ncbi:hypothetical protein BHE74_00059521 [Ensete ventricosum]|uniref:Uncharacterized protein n=1 Tax=Ensete ventricosum TaxID=4639 RepID=A0A426XK73_ENSVE|nr:hypothetical protein B296_00042110 [Ensete ventricosum]RWW35539.1 hypothetical protein BHE74_00059521 [Ensete ventricosum]